MKCFAVSFAVRDRLALCTVVPYTTLFRSWPLSWGFSVHRLWGRKTFPRGSRSEQTAHRAARQAAQSKGHNHFASRSEEHTSELQSPCNLVCRLLLEKKNESKQLNVTRPAQ